MINLYKNRAIETFLSMNNEKLENLDNTKIQTLFKELYHEYIFMLTSGYPHLVQSFVDSGITKILKKPLQLKFLDTSSEEEIFSQCGTFVIIKEEYLYYCYNSRFNIKIPFNDIEACKVFIMDCLLSDLRSYSFNYIHIMLTMDTKEQEVKKQLENFLIKTSSKWGLSIYKTDIYSLIDLFYRDYKTTFGSE